MHHMVSVDCPQGQKLHESNVEMFLGYFSPAGSACPQGTGGSQPIEPCEQGHYCPPGTGSQADNACKPGTWSPLSNLTSQSECFVCDEGHYCAGGEAQISGKCGRGHYCPAGMFKSSYSSNLALPGYQLVCSEQALDGQQITHVQQGPLILIIMVLKRVIA